MPDSIQFVLWLLGFPGALGLCALLVFGIEWIMWQVGHAAASCQNRLGVWRADIAERSLRQEDDKAFVGWLAAKTGRDLSGSVDQELVAAHKQSDMIRALVEEEVPKAVLKCVETHRLMASVTGAYHLFEIAYEPECHRLRAGVIWLLDHTVRLLDSYPLRLDDAHLLHNSIVLRKRALPTCRRCPYIQLTVHEAPRLCPTAELVQLRGIDNAKAH